MEQDSPATSIPTSSLWSSLNSYFTSTVFFILLNLMIATIVFTSNLPNNFNNQHQQQDDEDREQKQNINHDRNQQQIARSPSILNRLKSFNFYPQNFVHESNSETHYHPQPLEVAATQYVFNQNLDYQHFDIDSSNPDRNLNNFNSFHNFNELGEIERSGAEIRVENVTNGYDFDSTRPETLEHTGSEPNRQVEEDADEFESLDEVYSRLKTGRHDRTKSDGNIRRKPAAQMKKSASMKVGFSPEEENVEARRPATVKEKRSTVRVTDEDDDDDVEVDSRADDFINKFKNDLKLQRIESIIRTKGGMNRGTGN